MGTTGAKQQCFAPVCPERKETGGSWLGLFPALDDASSNRVDQHHGLRQMLENVTRRHEVDLMPSQAVGIGVFIEDLHVGLRDEVAHPLWIVTGFKPDTCVAALDAQRVDD